MCAGPEPVLTAQSCSWTRVRLTTAGTPSASTRTPAHPAEASPPTARGTPDSGYPLGWESVCAVRRICAKRTSQEERRTKALAAPPRGLIW